MELSPRERDGRPPDPPFVITRPVRQTMPLVFASPHSGRNYPADLLLSSRLSAVALRRSEDGFVEELFGEAPGLGAPLLAATFPRVYCDANREAWELDPTMFDGPLPEWVNTASPRVGAGLGTIARITGTGEPVYDRRLSFAEASERIERLWRPYHGALTELIAETRARFGYCLLVDCHSMPSGIPAAGRAEFILGDAHGTACAPRATRVVEEALIALGRRVRRNDPYAGGYVTRHYGRPREGVHALQIEISRALYMDERRVAPLPSMHAVRNEITAVLRHLAETDWSFLRP
ncbi:N-formylglutamate amidohydrolase [Roseomonas elaeocarpi]|uniref:N-formylglutamate amidohydrolase n=1 Tax=Roseomonas elaeocarpi TaxID=907779 RepID=A0ABV6JUK9_9PROT